VEIGKVQRPQKLQQQLAAEATFAQKLPASQSHLCSSYCSIAAEKLELLL